MLQVFEQDQCLIHKVQRLARSVPGRPVAEAFPLSFPPSEVLHSIFFLLKYEGFESPWESRFWQMYTFTWNREPFRKKLYSGEQCQGCGDEGLRETKFSTCSKKIPLLSSMWNLLVALI